MSNDLSPPDVCKPELSPALDFFAGTVAGMAAVVVGYPFDTVKVRFQNPHIASKYRSTFHALLTIVREERIAGLYRGMAAPLAGAPPLNGLVFSSYRSLLHAQLSSRHDIPTLTQITIAGAGTGIICALITTPAELIKIHQQSLVRTSTSAPLRDRDVIRHIFRTHGLRGFYRGITATALRDTGYGPYFAAYEATLRAWPRPHPPTPHATEDQVTSTLAAHSWPALLAAGGVAGLAGWLFTFPFDVVKTRVQSTPLPDRADRHHPYRSTWSTIRASYRAEGARVFFRGLVPTLVRAIPVNMVTFMTFEAITHLCA